MRRAGAIVLAAALMLVGASCSFKEWGKDFGGGLMDGIGEKSDTVAGKTAGGALDTLISAKTRRALDSMITDLGTSLAKQAALTRDSLLGEYTRNWMLQLKHDLLGASTKADLASIRDELLGARTRLMLSGLRSEVLGDTTLDRIGRIRDDLLGPKTNAAISVIVDSAMTSLVARYRQDLKPVLEGQVGFIQQHASGLLVLVAALAAGIIGLVWYEKQKYAKMLKVLTFQIHEIPDQGSYDDLTRRIQRQAQENGIEPALRKLLTEQGVLGREAWSAAKR